LPSIKALADKKKKTFSPVRNFRAEGQDTASNGDKPMKEIELYIHTAERRDPKLVKIDEDATVDDLLRHIASEANGDVQLRIEGEEEPHERHRKLRDCGIKHRDHIDCHHCHKVAVAVFYNSEQTRSFAPSATIEKVLHWALRAFGLTGADALDKELRLPGAPNEVLPESAHIGSFVKPHACEVRLSLTSKTEVNG
jgi:hypothetical protein